MNDSRIRDIFTNTYPGNPTGEFRFRPSLFLRKMILTVEVPLHLRAVGDKKHLVKKIWVDADTTAAGNIQSQLNLSLISSSFLTFENFINPSEFRFRRRVFGSKIILQVRNEFDRRWRDAYPSDVKSSYRKGGNHLNDILHDIISKDV